MKLANKASMLGRMPIEDFDLQAGGSGMSVADAVRHYMKTPGHLLASVRFFTGEELVDTAKRTGIDARTLTAYERGDEAPTFQHLALLARHFKADLRVFLEAFGHVNDDAAPDSLGLAAQFDGELTPSEKLDLKALMRSFKR